jgi:hypothetical protein
MIQTRSNIIILPTKDRDEQVHQGRAQHGDDDVDELGEPAAVVELGGAEDLAGRRAGPPGR